MGKGMGSAIHQNRVNRESINIKKRASERGEVA